MKKAKAEAETSASIDSRTQHKRRRRKKLYTDHIYGARLAHEDARIVDDYARLKGLERSDVVRLGLHQFALRQQMKYQPKDEFQELQERVFREHFAALFEQLEIITATFRELPQETNDRGAQRELFAARPLPENDEVRFDDNGKGNGVAPGVESLLREQRRTLEQVLLSSTLALRLLVNYLIEPQLSRLESPTAASFKPHLTLADGGKAGWSAATGEVVRRTGKQIMRELNLAPPEKKSGTPDAPQDGTRTTPATLSDSEIAAVL